MIPEEPTEESVKPILEELPPVFTRLEAIKMLEERVRHEDCGGLILDLAVTYGIYPDSVKVL